jgi:hypothetical protein
MLRTVAVILPAVWALGLFVFYSMCRIPHPPVPGDRSHRDIPTKKRSSEFPPFSSDATERARARTEGFVRDLPI